MRGSGTNEIVPRVGVSKPTVIAWKKRYAAAGIAGLEDRAEAGSAGAGRRGRGGAGDAGAAAGGAGGDALVEPAAGRAARASRTCGSPRSGASGVCSRGGGRRSSSPPTRSWRPRSATSSGCTWTRRTRRWCSRSTRSRQIQALDRTAPILPLRPGLPEKATHDYVRHGTTTLFAALEVATGKVTDACYPRHRHEEFLRFLKQVAKAYPRVKLHMVVRQLRHPQPPGGAGLAGPATRGSRCTSPRPPGRG